MADCQDCRGRGVTGGGRFIAYRCDRCKGTGIEPSRALRAADLLHRLGGGYRKGKVAWWVRLRGEEYELIQHALRPAQTPAQVPEGEPARCERRACQREAGHLGPCGGKGFMLPGPGPAQAQDGEQG